MATSTYNDTSTVTVQNLVDIAQLNGDTEPIVNAAGFSTLLPFTICNDVMNEIFAQNFPWKWNENNLPQFYTNSYQQDYALVYPVTGASVIGMSWLQRGVAIDINNTAIPKPFVTVEAGRSQQESTATFWNSATNNPGFVVNWMPNAELYYGTWGGSNLGTNSFGNNPYPGASYQNPLGIGITAASWAATGGGQATFTVTYLPTGTAAGSPWVVSNVYPVAYNGTWTVVSVNTSVLTAPTVTVSMPSNPGTYYAGGVVGATNLNQPYNPITQIIDLNGNFLVLTTYGTEGTTPPLAAANAAPGTTASGSGATTVWTVVDPAGWGMRILPIPSQTGVVWQFNMVAQGKPPRFTSMDQTLAPVPDEFEPHFRAGFLAQLYRYSPEAKMRQRGEQMWGYWLNSIRSMRQKEDRELEEYVFVTERGIMGGGRSRNQGPTAAWPFNQPRW